jgi:hypothetical protein
VADTLALENLYTQVVAALPGVPQPFGWREKPRHGEAARIVWQPGDPLGALGNIKGAEAKQPGRFPKRPLGTLHELFTVWIHAADLTKPRDEVAQYKATRLLFDEWYAAVYRIARGTFQIKSANWELTHIEGKFGGCLRVVATVEAMLPDVSRERAPTDTGAIITPAMVNSIDTPPIEVQAPFTSNDPYLWLLSNSAWPAPQLDSAKGFGYTTAQLSEPVFYGPAAHTFQLPRSHPSGDGDRGHSFSFCPDGTVIIAAVERASGVDPILTHVNDWESFYVVPAGASGELTAPQVRRIPAHVLFGTATSSPPVGQQGARFTAQMGDDVILGGFHGFVRIPRADLLDPHSDLSNRPRWYTDGGNGEVMVYDCAIDPRHPEWLWVEGNDQLMAFDFAAPPGLNRSIKMAQGSNIGDPTSGGWPGCLAFSLEGVWKVRSHTSDIILLDFDQLDALPAAAGGPNGNPTPARIMTSPVWSALNTNVGGLRAIVIDRSGGAWVNWLRWSENPNQSALMTDAWYFEAGQLAAGGSQMPVKTITNILHRAMSMRLVPGADLYLR